MNNMDNIFMFCDGPRGGYPSSDFPPDTFMYDKIHGKKKKKKDDDDMDDWFIILIKIIISILLIGGTICLLLLYFKE